MKKLPKNTDVRVVVQFVLPKGMGAYDLAHYVGAAVAGWSGQYPKSHPLFKLRMDRISVTVLRQAAVLPRVSE